MHASHGAKPKLQRWREWCPAASSPTGGAPIGATPRRCRRPTWRRSIAALRRAARQPCAASGAVRRPVSLGGVTNRRRVLAALLRPYVQATYRPASPPGSIRAFEDAPLTWSYEVPLFPGASEPRGAREGPSRRDDA